MTAKDIMEVRQNMPFDILVANVPKMPVYVPKRTVPGSWHDSMVNIIDQDQVYKERHHTVATVKAGSKTPLKRTNAKTTR